ncbi:endo alpha-1,4 polygalactosaminidase [Krasilnikovia sp. MM14-A1259]
MPAPDTTWQWQLSGPIDLSFPAKIYDIDGFENDAKMVAKLHSLGRKAVCYVEVGSAAKFRPDYRDWPTKLLGKTNGWPGERWLDIRDPSKLKPVLAKRFDMCKAKGFDGIEPDLMDGFANDTGFPLTAAHQLRFNRFIAQLAHERGLSVALKNDVEQVSQLVGDFDFAVNESCNVYHECYLLTPFIKAGKAVLHAEYTLPPSAYCDKSRRLHLSSLRKNTNLDAFAIPCPTVYAAGTAPGRASGA